MPVLDSKLRSRLDDVCQKARDLAEDIFREIETDDEFFRRFQ